MLANPKPGQRVVIRYNRKVALSAPLHGRTGFIVIAGRGKPRNHGVSIDGEMFVVPCGNLQKMGYRP